MKLVPYLLRAVTHVSPKWGARLLWRMPAWLTKCDALVTYRDFKIVVDTGEELGRRVFYYRDYESTQEDAFARLLNGGLVFDVGANVGIYSLLAARRGAEVIAFEPSRLARQYLKRNVDLNAGSINVIPEAVSDVEGVVSFYEARTGNYGVGRIFPFGQGSADISLERYDVQCNTLDHFVAKYGKPKLVKIDIEGAECLALAGASKTLGEPDAPVLMIEFHPRELAALGSSTEQCFAVLDSYRYRRYAVTDSHSHSWFVFSKRPLDGFIELPSRIEPA